MKKDVRHKGSIILTLYMTYAAVSTVFLYGDRTWYKLLGAAVVVALLSYLISVPLMKIIGRYEIMNFSPHKPDQGISLKTGFVFATLSLAILLVWFAAFFPGSYQEDILNQIKQAMTGKYDTWHPVWHTLVFFTVPLKLTHNTIWIIVLLQLIWFSLSIGYMCSVICRYAGIRWGLGVFAYIMLNPYTGYILLFAYKDVAFAIACLLAITMTAHMYMSGEMKRAGWLKCILLGFVLANATLFRYNGLLFTVALVVILLFHMEIPRCLTVAFTMILTMIIIQGPVYDAVGTVRSDTEVIQVVGMPMSIIGNAVVKTPDEIPGEVTDFAYSISPREVWEERYQRGDFNLMKYGGIYNQNPIEERSAMEIMGYALECVKASPEASADAWFALTDFVYGLDIRDKADIDVMKNDIRPNDLGIEPAGNPALASVLDLYSRALRLKGYNVFRKLSFAIFALISVMIAKLKDSFSDTWKKVLFGVPVLAYDFGTMLLLSGHDSRFFFFTFPVTPVVIIMMLYHSREKG